MVGVRCMEDSILQGCIPVVIQDGIFLPYENVLNYQSFAVRISEDEIPNLIRILWGVNETMIEMMLGNVRMIWQRFLYHDSVLLEAERQKKIFGKREDWAVEYSKLREDDVFSTFIQLKLEGLQVDEEKMISDPELLAEILEIREAVEEANDLHALEQIKSELQEKLQNWSHLYREAFEDRKFEDAVTSIQRMTYYERAIQEIVKKL